MFFLTFEELTKHCRFKGGGSTTTSYTPTEEERKLMQLEYDKAVARRPDEDRLNSIGMGLLQNSMADLKVDYTGMNKAAQKQIKSAQGTVQGLINGELPTAYEQNMQSIINRGVQNSAGNLLNGLAQKGVINSSVMNQGMKDISDSAANAMADSYTQNIGLLSQLAGQQTDQATAGIAAAAAAQEAAQQAGFNYINGGLGLGSAGTNALAAVAGKGTTTQTQSGGGGGFWGGLAGGLVGLFCFIGSTKVDTPHGKVKIRDIKKGDKVISFNPVTGEDEITEVLKVSEPMLEKVFAIQTLDVDGNAHYVVTTKSQPLMRPDGSYVTLKNIIIGQTELKGVGIVKLIAYNGKQPVYDLCVTGSGNYYANDFIAQDGSELWGKE